MKDLNKIERLLINVDMVNGFVNYGAMHDKFINHIVIRLIGLMLRNY